MLFGKDFNAESYQALLQNELDRWIDVTMDSIIESTDITDIDKALVRPLIADIIMGDNGT